ncbi:helix-turn-helix domain-containing protein [Herbiconiux sp. L3-i23]|uniref:helix-turn-helix domain-containing protein n=1 Tax=Herbiconiux sp. L3-i23 TaxID=2905871 RepID=UPI002059226D|nr:helix-turn-helix transcriptional regulator [Herbiconiux sp. L3-i23]BDI24158.1 hypothetical protein L3i23_29340 [Herbiconiux sp. L3-i23]
MSRSPSDADPTPSGKPAAGPLWREVLGAELRGLRRARGETLAAVGQRAGVSAQYLSELERGVKEPSSEIVGALAASLDRSLLDLALGAAARLSSSAAALSTKGEVALAA